MADEKPVPETLESIAASIRELRTSTESRFDEMKAQLRTEIESVRSDVRLVAEGFAAQTILLEGIHKDHGRLEKRVDSHDLRILALEPKTLA